MHQAPRACQIPDHVKELLPELMCSCCGCCHDLDSGDRVTGSVRSFGGRFRVCRVACWKRRMLRMLRCC